MVTIIAHPVRRASCFEESNPMRRLNPLQGPSGNVAEHGRATRRRASTVLHVEALESRTLLDASVTLNGGLLSVVGGPGREQFAVTLDASRANLVVKDHGRILGQFASAQVNQIAISVGNGDSLVTIAPNVLQPATIAAGAGNDILRGGGGPTRITAGPGRDTLFAGLGASTLQGGAGADTFFAGPTPDVLLAGTGHNRFFRVKPSDTVVANPGDRVYRVPTPAAPNAAAPTLTNPPPDPNVTLAPAEVEQLLQRAAAASSSNDGIVAVVDRNGRPLGVRVEGNVSSQITGDPEQRTFAIDGALAEARTAALFSNNAAPLTSRTIQFISQTTTTQREVDSNPDLNNPNSPLSGPGFVAPIGLHGHFPPNIPLTPQVDLFDIEATNRDTTIVQTPGGPVRLPNRFNVPNAFVPPGANLPPIDSYGFLSGLDPSAQPRGIGTLPGGVPIFKNGVLVGGIGVFFPGTTGYASEENSSLSSNFDPSKPDRTLEAEYDAFAAVGGAPAIGAGVGTVGGVAPVAGVAFPLTPTNQRIDLNGITLDIVGPGGTQGPFNLLSYAQAHYRQGNPNSGNDQPLDPQGDTLLSGKTVPDGWLVTPHAGDGLTANDVTRIIQQGISQAQQTRAAIRLPLGTPTSMVFAVSDKEGNILGLYRMPDATIFSIGVAVAKARNNAYYADPTQLQAADQVAGVAPGTAFSSRTFRYLALPHFPEGIDFAPPAPFSVLNDGGSSLRTGLNTGTPLPASAFQSVQGFNDFNPNRNFHDPNSLTNQNGVVFFPGGVPVYKDLTGAGKRGLVGGLGVSGDGVAQDDAVTAAAAAGTEPNVVPTADQVFVNGIRLPYVETVRNPTNL